MQGVPQPIKKPMLSSQKKTNGDSYDKKIEKSSIFYR